MTDQRPVYLHKTLDRLAARLAHVPGAEAADTIQSEIEGEAMNRIARGCTRASWQGKQSEQAGDLWRLLHDRNDAPSRFARFLENRREPVELRAEYAETCRRVAEHLTVVAEQCWALTSGGDQEDRWSRHLIVRCAETARDRASVWLALARVAQPAALPGDECSGCEVLAFAAELDARGLCDFCAAQVAADPWVVVGSGGVVDPGPYTAAQAEHRASVYSAGHRPVRHAARLADLDVAERGGGA